jgi:hypothetical protein
MRQMRPADKTAPCLSVLRKLQRPGSGQDKEQSQKEKEKSIKFRKYQDLFIRFAINRSFAGIK